MKTNRQDRHALLMAHDIRSRPNAPKTKACQRQNRSHKCNAMAGQFQFVAQPFRRCFALIMYFDLS